MATSSIPSTLPEGPSPVPGPPPPLENGDRLTRDEFERRYHAMPHVKKAELIEGVVYISSPVRTEQHGEPHLDLGTFLGLYRHYTPGVRGGDNSTIRLDLKNEPQPDDILFRDPSLGGKARLDADGYVSGAPELAAEISASSVSVDLGPKLVAYRRCGIQEYIVWRVLDRAFDWFELISGDYARLEAGEDGVLRSKVFPGLWLDAAAILPGDFPRAHSLLQEGLASAEHQPFVETMRQA
ncbi:MAG: Uma2 family endonuclease [Gemmataceae bacterium]